MQSRLQGRKHKKIARNISNYSGVLDLLQESLHNDESLYTQRALKLADSLSKQSQTIFGEIREIVPGSPPWDGFKWREKTQWAFRKSKVDALVGEIEHLKTTLNLLLQTMIIARQTYLALGKDKDKRYTIRAEQALYEQFDASERLSMLRKQETEEEKVTGAFGKRSSTTSSQGTLVSYNDPVLSAFQHQYSASNASSKEKAARLRADSPLWLDQMKAEWFSGEGANRHLSLQLVKGDPGSSSENREQRESEMRDEYEEQIRELRERLAESQKSTKERLDSESAQIRKYFEKMEADVIKARQSERLANEKYASLQAQYSRSEQKNREDRVRMQEERERIEQAFREDRERLDQTYREDRRLMM